MPYHDTATRAQALALKVFRATNTQIEAQTGLTRKVVNQIIDRAIEQGFDPRAEQPTILNSHVATAPKSKRPEKQSQVKESVLAKVQRNRYGHKKTYAHIANELDGISAITV